MVLYIIVHEASWDYLSILVCLLKKSACFWGHILWLASLVSTMASTLYCYFLIIEEICMIVNCELCKCHDHEVKFVKLVPMISCVTEKTSNHSCKCQEQERKIPSTTSRWTTWLSFGSFTSYWSRYCSYRRLFHISLL